MLFLPLIAIAVVAYVIASSLYRETNYYKATRKSLICVFWNKGTRGEFLTYLKLRSYEKDGARFLFNCYLPKDNGETSEVDVLMIHRSGIYVYECKHYSGWIFGSDQAQYWRETFFNGKKVSKFPFYNPIKQNATHIKWLKEKIGGGYPIYSVIVFSGSCTLKKLDLGETDAFVVKINRLLRIVREIKRHMGDVLPQEQVDELFKELYPHTQVGDLVKRKHIEDINRRFPKNHGRYILAEGEENEEETLVCPRCGGKLIYKILEKGTYAGTPFYYCCNFPECMYIRKTKEGVLVDDDENTIPENESTENAELDGEDTEKPDYDNNDRDLYENGNEDDYGFGNEYDDENENEDENLKNDDEVNSDDNGYESEEHICPKCGAKLLYKHLEEGPYAGTRFYYCSNYPNCKYMEEL